MGDSFPIRVPLPQLKQKFGEEPRHTVVINQASSLAVVKKVKDLLGEVQFGRVKSSFMGPLVLAGERGLDFSGKLVHFIMSRQILTRRKNELWFRFAAQPMRFSIREFHMVTGIKCSGPEFDETEEEEETFEWPRLDGRHTLRDVEDQLRETPNDSEDERFCLGMLMLIEGILLHKYSAYKFPASYAAIAKDIHKLQNHPWGKVSYQFLLESVKKANVENVKYDLHGFPMALQLWMLASVPLLQTSFSAIDVLTPRNAYICTKFTKTQMPTLAQIENVEAVNRVKVFSILPSIEGDPEDSVCLEDEDDTDLDSVLDLIKQGYRLKITDWESKVIDVGEAMEEIARQSYQFGRHGENRAQPSNNQDMMTKITDIHRIMVREFKSLGMRLQKIEQHLNINTNQETNVDDDEGANMDGAPSFHDPSTSNIHPSHNPSPSPARQENQYDGLDDDIVDETQPVENDQENQNDGLDDIALDDTQPVESQNDIPISHDPSTSHKGNQNDGVDDVTMGDTQPVETHHDIPISHNPSPSPTLSQEEAKKIKLLSTVEAFHNGCWMDAKVRAILRNETFTVELSQSQEQLTLEKEKLRIKRTEPERASSTSEKGKGKQVDTLSTDQPSFNLHFDTPTEKNEQPEMRATGRKNKKGHGDVASPMKKMKYAQPTQAKLEEEMLLRRSKRALKPSPSCVSPFTGPKNPATSPNPPHHDRFDPFLSPTYDKINQLEVWKNSANRRPFKINGKEIDPTWFNDLENINSKITAEHIEAAMMMMWLRRNNDEKYFHNNKIPKAIFVSQSFMTVLRTSYRNFQKEKANVFRKELIEVVKGIKDPICPPLKKLSRQSIIYAALMSYTHNEWIGLAMDISKRRIKVLHCPKITSMDYITKEVQRIAGFMKIYEGFLELKDFFDPSNTFIKNAVFSEMIPALLACSSEEFQDRTPFTVECKAKGMPKTENEKNCGLFVVKMIECHSMGMRDMSKISDERAEDMRTKYASDIFNELATLD